MTETSKSENVYFNKTQYLPMRGNLLLLTEIRQTRAYSPLRLSCLGRRNSYSLSAYLKVDATRICTVLLKSSHFPAYF